MIKEAEEILKDPKAYDSVKICLASLRKKVAILEKCDGDILESLSEEADIMDEIAYATEYDERLVTLITKAELALKYYEDKLKSGTKVENEESSNSGTSKEKESTVQMKLPPLQIGEYNGSLLTWSLFWDKFDVAIHSRKDLSDIQKYTYLKAALIGEAKSAIQGVSYDKENYGKAIEILTARFGNKQLRVAIHQRCRKYQ